TDEADFCEARVKQYDAGSFHERLEGNGSLSLIHDDPKAEILCFRYHDDGRRSIPIPYELWDMRDACIPLEREDGTLDIGNEMHNDFAHIGSGNLEHFPLARGSYLILIRRPGFDDVRLPVQLGRSEKLTVALTLPKANEIVAGFAYVPNARFIYGGDPNSNNVHRQVLDNDAFAIARFPVTSGEYLEFLRSLEGEEQAQRQPRETFTNKPLWQVEGRLALPDTWDSNFPVVGISWEDAMAYAAWLSAKEERDYTLPTESQWEHAARGADGRFFPWGRGVDATFLNCSGSRKEGDALVAVDSYPIDESPFGVRGMGGNVRDWCLDNPGSRRKDLRIVRGGFWSNPANYARSASRPALNQREVSWEVGFRLVQVLDEGV
ncbi:MAG: formylglycine-generating enzyme family protein, partial [Planctomycetes bacterium]|nr:formylglycine-generating enzyme family protein [Planctomycetota bacterium]